MLLALRLENTPAKDVIAATAKAWQQAIWPRWAWNEKSDSYFIDQAFLTLSRIQKRWPVPAEFFEVYPRPTALIPPQPKLKKMPSDAEHNRVSKTLKTFAEKMRYT